MKYKRLFATVLLAMAVTACGSKEEEVTVENTNEHVRDTKEENTDPGETDPVVDEEALPGLAKRMEGKYSYHLGGENGEDEYLIMNVVSFGNNLYAYCGEAIGDGSGELEAYSFWATEFIPDNAADMSDPEADSIEVTALNFSVMSNAGKYWGSGVKGSITLDRDGLVFENFDNDGFLVPEHDASRLFLKDERVEAVFPYLNNDIYSGDGALQGYWVYDKGTAPVYMQFLGSDVYVYYKPDNIMVSFSGGGCAYETKHFDANMNTLGNGTMPWEWSADYEVDGDELKLTLEGDPIPGGLSGKVVMKRCKEEEVHTFIMSEAVFDEDSFGYYGELTGAYEDNYENGFYGVWTGAVKDRDDAITQAKALNELGYDSFVAYSPEWENLNSDPYYCVSAGRCESETEAEDMLDEIQQHGQKDAYVKFSGAHKYTVVCYYNYGNLEPEINKDSVVLKDVSYGITGDWSEFMEGDDAEYTADLVIDKDTVFDENCETEFFGNYEDGDTPLDWFIKNYEYMESDPDMYMSNGPALSGVFAVGIRGNHIERFFGSYWWD